MQQLRDKLAIAERTAKAEAQMKVHNVLSDSKHLIPIEKLILKYLTDFTGKISIALQSFGRKG